MSHFVYRTSFFVCVRSVNICIFCTLFFNFGILPFHQLLCVCVCILFKGICDLVLLFREFSWLWIQMRGALEGIELMITDETQIVIVLLPAWPGCRWAFGCLFVLAPARPSRIHNLPIREQIRNRFLEAPDSGWHDLRSNRILPRPFQMGFLWFPQCSVIGEINIYLESGPFLPVLISFHACVTWSYSQVIFFGVSFSIATVWIWETQMLQGLITGLETSGRHAFGEGSESCNLMLLRVLSDALLNMSRAPNWPL